MVKVIKIFKLTVIMSRSKVKSKKKYPTVHRSHHSMTDVPRKYEAVAIYSF